MNFIRILNFSKLSILNLNSARSITTNTSPVYFQATNILFAEPLKKKKRMDPQILRQREERKKKKIEKQIRRLEKLSKQLKPISENEVSLTLIDEREKRLRKVPAPSISEIEEEVFLRKEWCRYQTYHKKRETNIINNMIRSQQKALDELKAESMELYLNAVSIDPDLLPYEHNGPVHTPPIKNYPIIDGEYLDISRKYDGE